MRTMTAAEVVTVWEQAQGQRPLRLALDCLVRAEPHRDWASIPFGSFCRGLFAFRSVQFGSVMPGVVACPQCGERLEFSFQCDSVADESDEQHRTVRARATQLRLPSVGDLLAAASVDDLVARCALAPVSPDAALIAEVSALVAQADPMAETLLRMSCPACGNAWDALLDIVTYLGQEIAREARRLLLEVHHLAMAYGWSEAETLALSAARRRAYLELAGVA